MLNGDRLGRAVHVAALGDRLEIGMIRVEFAVEGASNRRFLALGPVPDMLISVAGSYAFNLIVVGLRWNSGWSSECVFCRLICSWSMTLGVRSASPLWASMRLNSPASSPTLGLQVLGKRPHFRETEPSRGSAASAPRNFPIIERGTVTLDAQPVAVVLDLV